MPPMLDRKTGTENLDHIGSVPLWICPKNDRCVVRVLPRSEKTFGGDGSLKANGLMLALKNANRKSVSYWFLEGGRNSSTVT